jgi:hypothetical protein
VDDGTRSSSREPARPKIAAVPVALRSRQWTGDGADHKIQAAGEVVSEHDSQWGLVSSMIRGFQPPVPASSPDLRQDPAGR